jgi:hypothetical protein
MSKLVLAGAFATGYVLGARAGHERYEQIERAIDTMMNAPRVRETVSKVRGDDSGSQEDTLVYSAGPDIEETVEVLAPADETQRP